MSRSETRARRQDTSGSQATTGDLDASPATARSERRRAEDERALEAGAIFGGYQLVGPLGMGGFAVAWEAVRLSDQRRLALKILRSSRKAGDAVRRFEMEGRLMASLSHDRTVYVFAAELIDGCSVIAMELLHGGTLQDRLDREEVFKPAEAVDAILDVIEGLEAAQQLGIIHRDVKPSNCFVDENGRVKVGDFGIAKSFSMAAASTATGAFVGTLAFAAPEQVTGDPVDFRADMHAVGATLHYLLTGRPPFEARTPEEVIGKIAARPAPPFAREIPGMPAGLESVVLRLLAKRADDRYATYAEVRQALLPFSSHRAPAGNPALRTGAFMLDVLVVDFPVTVVLVLLTPPAQAVSLFATLSYVSEALRWAWPGVLAWTVAYFAACEWCWGATLGKRVFGLRVERLAGGRLSLRQALARAMFFHAPQNTASHVVRAIAPTFALAGELLGTGLWLALLTSMRARNGWATLHDLWTGTRVRSRVCAPLRRCDPPQADEPATAGAPLRERGPYLVVERMWESGGESLSLGRDVALRRSVWIHERDSSLQGSHVADAEPRPGRLRYLQSGESEGRSWTAHAAPTGASVEDVVRRQGRLPWATVRLLASQLCDELLARERLSTLPASLGLAHVWIDAAWHVRLLDCPARLLRPEERTALPPSRLVQQVMLLGLLGEVVAAAELPGLLPELPLPLHARSIVRQACGEESLPVSDLATGLRGLLETPAAVSPLMRAALVLVSGFPLALCLPGVLVTAALKGIHGGWAAVEGSLQGFSLKFGAAALGVALLMSLAAFTFRGGPVMHLLGLCVQDERGRPAGRLRCIFRTLLGEAAPYWLLAMPYGVLPASLVFFGLSLHALLHPDRGLADRLARTVLVPR